MNSRFCQVPACNRLANVYAIDTVEDRGWADFYCNPHVPLGFAVIEHIQITGYAPGQ